MADGAAGSHHIPLPLSKDIRGQRFPNHTRTRILTISSTFTSLIVWLFYRKMEILWTWLLSSAAISIFASIILCVKPSPLEFEIGRRKARQSHARDDRYYVRGEMVLLWLHCWLFIVYFLAHVFIQFHRSYYFDSRLFLWQRF